MSQPTIDDVLRGVKAEFLKSIQKHDDWSTYSLDKMISHTMDEVVECLNAHHIGDVMGQHGVLVEGTQAAACFCKMLLQIAIREQASTVTTQGVRV